MFIKNSEFKKLLKDAYKYHELNVGRTNNGVFVVESPSWHMEVMEEYMTNEVKALLVELIGDLPAAGQAMSFRETQEMPQNMMLDCLYENLWNKIMEPEWIEMEQTRVYLQTDGTLCNLLQPKKLTSDNTWIPVAYLNTVDKRRCDEEENFNGPIANVNDVMWWSEEMAFRCKSKAPRFKGERELLRVTNGIDMNWPQTEVELI